MAATGGTPTPVTVVDRDHSQRTHRWPQILPGGQLLYTVYFLNSADRRSECSPTAHLVWCCSVGLPHAT